MKVSELGEFGLIELIARTIREGSAAPPDLLIGIGDDAAAWRNTSPVQLATTDTLVDSVHFVKEKIDWTELGWKSLAVNLSDIAAMGGSPKYALVTLGLPDDTLAGDIVSLYRGMLTIANSFGVTIAGGDTVRSPVTVITVSLFGVMENNSARIMTRSAASPGDAVGVTGFLGASAAGLKMLLESLTFTDEAMAYFRKAHCKPEPRVSEGQKMVRAGVRCAIDVSDGLIGDLTHVCEASRAGARILLEQIPVHPLVKAAFPDEYTDLALSGGEDYELLFTAAPAIFSSLRRLISTPVTAIGEITRENPGRVILADKKGQTFVKSKTGWDHFSTGKPSG